MMSSELPSPDCPPVRIRLLSENLIAFRTTSGAVGVVANACPHRGASLFFGRNEEEGLRCVYHGWKFDVAGNCIDMPSEPAESNFKTKVHALAYPTQERGGLVWIYMGPRAVPPPLPDLEVNMLPEGQYFDRLVLLGVQLAAVAGGRLRHDSRRLPAPGLDRAPKTACRPARPASTTC